MSQARPSSSLKVVLLVFSGLSCLYTPGHYFSHLPSSSPLCKLINLLPQPPGGGAVGLEQWAEEMVEKEVGAELRGWMEGSSSAVVVVEEEEGRGGGPVHQTPF